jgi:hypothetical protein
MEGPAKDLLGVLNHRGKAFSNTKVWYNLQHRQGPPRKRLRFAVNRSPPPPPPPPPHPPLCAATYVSARQQPSQAQYFCSAMQVKSDEIKLPSLAYESAAFSPTPSPLARTPHTPFFSKP